jgi:predicted metal-dependent hydrolase
MEAAIHKFNYGSKQIQFTLHYSDRKSLGIKVLPDSSVQIVAPLNADINTIKEKAKTKAAWILKQQLNFCAYKPYTPSRLFINGETHLYLGRQYLLEIINTQAGEKTNYIKLIRGKMQVHTTNKEPVQVEKIILQFYKQKALQIFIELLEQCKPLHPKFRIDDNKVKIKLLAKRWGSCTANGTITLNTELIKASKACIEYVIIHELCHLVHYNHNAEFYALQAKFCANWTELKHRLECLLA